MKKSSNIYNLGFTLIELLIVISIIGVLSSMVVSSTSDARMKSRDAFRISQIREVRNAIELYYSNNGFYPYIAGGCFTPICVPQNWSSLLTVLITADLIHPTLEATGMPIYYGSSIQDSLYKTSDDYLYSYGFMVYGSERQNYKLRIYLEDPNNRIFQSSQSGTFLDSETTGNTACDKNFHYYCTGN